MLKTLMLRKKIEERTAELDELKRQAEDLQKREAELEQAIDEAKTDEEKKAVEEAVDAHEKEKKENQEKQDSLSGEIAAAEAEIKKLEENAPKAGAASGAERKENKPMETRTNFFDMNMQERDAFFARRDVKEFFSNVRDLAHRRDISGAELTIPPVMLPLIREVALRYSKLSKHINMRRVPGTTRINIMGTVPEAVWTEMCAAINEVSIGFNQVQLDGYKLGAFIAICNAILEDSDVNLGPEVISALGQGIGYAWDKSTVFGTGVGMPLGIVTRLQQTTKPANYPPTAREWENLSEKNIINISSANSSGTKLFQNLIAAAGRAKSTYSRGEKFWTMNETTFSKLTAEALSINSAGAIVTGMNRTMPIIGGEIELLDFMGDDVIVGGYGDLYVLAERAGTKVAMSEHARFIQDQTLFKATSREDGTPVIPEAFVAITINGATIVPPAFPADKANTPAAA